MFLLQAIAAVGAATNGNPIIKINYRENAQNVILGNGKIKAANEI